MQRPAYKGERGRTAQVSSQLLRRIADGNCPVQGTKASHENALLIAKKLFPGIANAGQPIPL
jgi:hypothetical protein